MNRQQRRAQKGSGPAPAQGPAAGQQKDEVPEVWCPRCAGPRQLEVFQIASRMVMGQVLLVFARCGECHLLLWPLATIPLNQGGQDAPDGGLLVPRGVHLR